MRTYVLSCIFLSIQLSGTIYTIKLPQQPTVQDFFKAQRRIKVLYPRLVRIEGMNRGIKEIPFEFFIGIPCAFYLSSKSVEKLLSDTVGFIQQLPHNLIEAFKSTLAELQYADLLLQVIDIADPNWQDHIRVVRQILDELEVTKPMLFVFNKADKLTPEEYAQRMALIELYTPNVVISASSKESAAPLLSYLQQWHEQLSQH